jgi:large subunit ribosomal protein L35
MPKMKTHSGAKKRFKITGTGKITHRSAGKRHLNEHKSSRAMRRLMPDAAVQGSDLKKVRRLLGK